MKHEHPLANEGTGPAALYERGVCFAGAGENELAVECFNRVLTLDPNFKDAVLLLGRCLRDLKRNTEAEDVYRRALANEPDDAVLYVEFAHVLADLGKFDEAGAVFRKAMQLAPDDTGVLGQAGYFHQRFGNSIEAIDLYQRYLEHLPDDVPVLTNLGVIKGRLGQYEEAEHYLRRALERTESPSRILIKLAAIQSSPRDSLAYLNRALEADQTYAAARTNRLILLNLLDGVSNEELYQAHLEWQRWHAEPLPAERSNFFNLPDPNRKIRIGYLSGDLCGSVISYFIEGALQCHDRRAFEIYCYANVDVPDATTKRLQSYGHHWRSVFGVNANAAAEVIRHDGIDILVDLSGYSNRYRLDIVTKKPAPIQVTWIGYPNTLGLEAVDYRLVDFITDPPGSADAYHSEVLWRLPGCFLCYTTTSNYPYSRDLKARETGAITFGSFNRVAKISVPCLKAWARVLARVENSKLIIKSSTKITGKFRDQVYAVFGTCDIDKNRVEFVDRQPAEKALQHFGTIDIALDTFPYNGTTTTCECMWMGVPVICLRGDRHATRVSASLLTQVGLERCIGDNIDGYVECAARLANDIDGLAKIRVELRERLLASPLCDARTHTANLETAYREMWKAWCDGKEHEKLYERADEPLEKTARPPMRIIHGFGNLVFDQLTECLKAMGGVNVLTDMHPLGMAIFDPIQQAQDRYGLFEDREWEVVSRKKLSFGERLSRIQEAARCRNQSLVITDWNHLDFIAKPYLSQAENKLATNLALNEEFEVTDVFFLRHPLPQWLFYCSATSVNEFVTVEEFLACYRRFIEVAMEGAWFRCEDFARNPGSVLEKICCHLRLHFDPGFMRNSDTEFSADIPGDVDPELSARLAQSEDYTRILKLLSYDSR